MQAILQFKNKRTHFSLDDFVQKMWQLTPDEPIEINPSGQDYDLNVLRSWRANLFSSDYKDAEPDAGWEALDDVNVGVEIEPFKRKDWLWVTTDCRTESLVIIRAYVVMVDLLMQELESVISLDLGQTWLTREEFIAPYEPILRLNRAEILRITALETLNLSGDEEIEPPAPLRWD